MTCVAHLVHTWLHYSETFIGAQVSGAREFQPMVLAQELAQKAAGPQPFPVENLYARDALTGWRLWRERIFSRLRGNSDLFLRAIHKHKPKCLHAHFGHVAWSFLPLVRATGLPLVTSFYSFDSSAKPRQPGWPERYLELFATGRLFLAISEDMRQDLIRLGCPPDKVRVHRLGIDLSAFEYRPPLPRKAGEPLSVLFMGRLVDKKGVPDLLEACARALRAGVDLRLDLAGDGDDRPSLEAQARGLGLLAPPGSGAPGQGLSDRVRFLGRVPYKDLAGLYRTHHLFVLPSRTAANGDKDDLSMVTLEALATGTPVLTTTHAGIAERFQDGVHLLLAREADPESLAAALVRFAAEPSLALTLTRQGRARVEQEFDLRGQLERQEAIYQDVAGLGGP